MITKNDCMTILVKLEDEGIDINSIMKKLVISKDVPIEVLKFINDNRGFEVSNFYEMLRVKHNKEKSPIYTNIVRCLDEDVDVITTLTALLLQISLYNKKLPMSTNFLKEVRAKEIGSVIHDYYNTFDETRARTLLSVIRADLLVLEYIAGRRDLNI